MSRQFTAARQRRLTLALVAVLVAAGAAAGLSASAAGRTTRPRDYWIVLGSNRDGWNRAYSVRPDGSRLTLLLPATRGPASPWVISRDGGTIVYDLGGRIAVSRANGTRLRPLLRNGSSLALSPDGKMLAFASGNPSHIFVIGTDGRGRRRLMSGDAEEPDWSPNGKALVFVERRGERTALVVQPLHGRRRVLVRGKNVAEPKWSPDGRWIAYGKGTGRNEALWLVQPSGATRRIVVRGFIFPYAWSPDGKRIAFELNDKVSVVGVDGRAPRRLPVRGLREITALSWSPDGRLLALESGGFSIGKVWVVGADGRGLRRVMHEGANSLVGWSRLAPVQPPAPPLLPSELVLDGATVATRTPIADLSADDQRVAFIVGWTAADCSHVVVWTPATRALDRFRKRSTSCAGGVGDVELAGSRAAWVTVLGCGNNCDLRLESATLERPSPVGLVDDSIDANEDPDYGLRGDGDLLVFDFGERLVRIGAGNERCDGAGTGGICATLRSGAHASLVDSVSGHLIAVREPDAVAVLDERGSLVNLFPFAEKEVKAARLDGGRLVVARLGVLEVYDAATGAGLLQRPLPAGYALTDVDGGIALLRHGGTILLLRLDDGKSMTLAPGRDPLLADLEPPGLYYSYATADGRGRLVFVPRSELERQLGSDER